tara:strand:+ start:122 stop:805 length:684 start_codon:yes stop_codon:yes gene_type:complete
MENIQSNIQGDNMETTTIQQLFQEFVNDGGEPKVTSFKRHLDKLINQEIKALCGRSAKTGLVNDWRSEVKARFSGRGAKWVKVAVDDIIPTLEGFDDAAEYTGWIQTAGFAWIRFAGPRVANGSHCAAFEVRTGGSTVDHPKQLHYIPVQLLDDKIEALNSTPHAMKLEEVATTPVVEEVEEEEVLELSGYELNPDDDGGSAWAEDGDEDMMGDIEDLMDDEDNLDF